MEKASPISPDMTEHTIYVPITEIDGEILSEHMDAQEEIANMNGGIIQIPFDASDNPNKEYIKEACIENGMLPEDFELKAPLSMTVGRTLKNKPEFMIANLDEETSVTVIRMVEEFLESNPLQKETPFVLENMLLQIQPMTLEDASKFKGTYEAFLATELLMTAKGLKPDWYQIIYAGDNYRFPWEIGANPKIYQPTPSVKRKFYGQGTAEA